MRTVILYFAFVPAAALGAWLGISLLAGVGLEGEMAAYLGGASGAFAGLYALFVVLREE